MYLSVMDTRPPLDWLRAARRDAWDCLLMGLSLDQASRYYAAGMTPRQAVGALMKDGQDPEEVDPEDIEEPEDEA